ncbi:MAG TPA: DUF6077 domain-containing protein [Ornithinibacter sp.]|jgi:hypothetical protein|uniref:DUF6077 domain-containing protein n=1 Tax=Ornithinibacter sp. TaxID=2862748 RepID=UPI001B729E4F|nr:DUF6077 domain-containing protein [Ornithinibacter sp.]MBP6524848.1 hypothetical protein [Dermatophilaceae bacterium]MBU9944036.1 hypothetical protein [Dermatophilaceae bacterium]HOT55606.1 DUF6077 domain-containing protein [Ornithinibacter sp.]HQV82333.1 DUF6077 domain-containing protein [Ornithinibacter sp.]HQW73216.1 DUF6077 domain-containing protein [Ornithinibacter sp.]
MTLGPLLERAGRSLVTAALVLFAVWTVVYQVALAVGLPSTPTLVVALLIGAGTLVLLSHTTTSNDSVVAPVPGAAVSLAVLGVTVVATALGAYGMRGPALALAVLTAVTALAVTARRGAPPAGQAAATGGPASDDASAADPRTWTVGWVGALVSAALASIIARPDGDDAYFVNLSAWVAEQGRFPLRDTMISPDVYPALGAHSPPVHSIEGLIGALARVLHIEAGTATYVLVPPLATALAVLVLTRIVTAARIPAGPVALLAALGFLWTTGGSGYSFGNFFAVRMWQGKSMLVSIVIPLVILFGVELIRRGSARAHLLFGASLIAAVGMSNTAVFLVPVLVGGLVLAALALREIRGAVRLSLWVVYPIIAGLATLVFATPSPTKAQLDVEGFVLAASRAGDPLMTVPGRHGIYVVSALALGLGILGLREVGLRTAAIGSLAAAGVMLLPPVRGILEGIGLTSVVWRMWWVVPIPLLVAGLVGAAALFLPRGWPRAVGGLLAMLLVVLVPLVGGRWVGSEGNNARFVSPMAWKVPRGALSEARFIEQVSQPGDIALAPWDTSRVLAALTVDVQPVSARRAYLPTYAGTPEAQAGSREELQEFADERTPGTDTIGDDLDAVGVDTACVGTSRGRAIDLLEANGFEVVGVINNLTCLRR